MKKPRHESLGWALRQQQRLSAKLILDANMHRHARKRGRETFILRRRKRTRMKTSVHAVPPYLLAERESSRSKVLNLVLSVRSALSKGRARVKLDFSGTKKIYPGGMLLLVAHLALLLEQFPRRLSAKCVPNSMAAQLLRHFGYADRLHVKRSISQPCHESVLNWRHVSGAKADGTVITQLLEDLRNDTKATIPEGLYEVLTEALTNVSHHAYPSDGQTPESLRKWWIFSRLDNPIEDKDGNLYIAIYDVGVGIQATMRRKLEAKELLLSVAEWGNWLTWPTRLLDQRLLAEAVEGQRSSTGLGFRGNGLPEMRDFVLQTQSGSLSIISGHAQYTCQADALESRSHRCNDHTMGTLILWSIPLKLKEPS